MSLDTFYDITVPMTNDMSVWEGDPNIERNFIITIEKEVFNL